MTAQPTAKARKRAAVAEVRELAAALGDSVSREKTDLNGNLREPSFIGSGNFPGTSFIGSGNLQDFPGTLPGTSNIGSGNLHPVCNLKL